MENTSLLKGILAQKSWPIDAVVERFDGVVGAIPLGGFMAPDLALIMASIPCQISPDRGAIGPRSNHNRESFLVAAVRWRSGAPKSSTRRRGERRSERIMAI